jgi:enoyl-CoA hydratase
MAEAGPTTGAIGTEVAGGVAVITINRPEARNAINGDVARGIAAAVEEFDARNDVSVLVLTGAGGTFSAGMDLKGFLAGDAPIAAGRGFGGIAERPPAKPVIAAVEGYALAGGFELVLACDLVVASEEAKFGLPEVRRGLVAGAGGLLRLPRRIPYHVAMEIALTGEHFPAARLAAVGLVNKLVPAGQALTAAMELANRVALGAPLALAASKRVIVESADWPASEAFARQSRIIGPVFGSKDAMEGAAAFAEKRQPAWRGE